jgi:hypothetical protein
MDKSAVAAADGRSHVVAKRLVAHHNMQDDGTTLGLESDRAASQRTAVVLTMVEETVAA